MTPPSGQITVTGREQLAWDQPASDATQLSGIGYTVYVDGTGAPYSGVTCASASPFTCQAPLPAMTPGPHAVELAAFFKDNPGLESPKGGPLNLLVVPQTGTAVQPSIATSRVGVRRAPGAPGANAAPVPDSAWPSTTARVLEGLDRPTDLAFTPDARLWLAERSGRIRAIHGNAFTDAPALTLPARADGTGQVVALAIDPQFVSNQFIYAIYTAPSRGGTLTFTLARFREVADTLADAVVLLDEVPASADAHAAVRFGPDAKLYAAFDNGADERLVDDLASFSGKMLRLNADGTTPDDAPRKSPILSSGFNSPRGVTWHRPSGQLWAADVSRVGPVHWPITPQAVAALGNDLYIGSDAGLARAHVDPQNPTRLMGATDLVATLPIRAVAVAPDGSVYFATPTAIGLLR
jgi:glucose/arabinose dehydrogenase